MSTSGVRRPFWLTLAVVTMAGLLVALPARPALAAPPTFSKSFSPATIGPGSVSTLAFAISNGDPAVVTDLAFSDTLPAGVTIATPANTTNTCNGTLSAPNGGSTISLTDGTVDAGRSCAITVDVTASTPGTHTNTTGDLTSSAGNSGTATADLTVATDRPGFSKSFSPATVSLGGRSTLTFTIDNTANTSRALYLLFTDTLPTGLVVADPPAVSNTCATGIYTGGVVTAVPGSGNVAHAPRDTFDTGAVAAGSSCTITVDVVATGSGTLGNSTSDLTVSVGTSGTTRSSGKANATLTSTVAAAVHLTKEFTDDPIAPGGTGTLRFTITNYNRSDDATDIGFTDDLDVALSGLVATGLPHPPCGTGSSLTSTSTLALTGGNVGPGGSCTFDVTVSVPSNATPGAYTNTTSAVTGTIGGSPVTGNAASDSLFVTAAPVLTKAFTDDPVGTGGTVTLEFTITDQSTAGSSDIEFFDDLSRILPVLGNPSPVTLPADGFCGPGSSLDARAFGVPQGLLMTGGSLAAGASCTFSATIAIPDGMGAGTYTNTTDPITATVGGVTVTGNSASDDLIVVGAPTLTKQFTDDPILPGDTVTLEFTLSNGAGGGADDSDEAFPITGIGFTDSLGFAPGLTALGLPQTEICGDDSSFAETGGVMTFSGGSLDPFESCTFSVTLQSAASTPQGTHSNTTGIVTATSEGVAVTGPSVSDDLTVVALTLTKEFTNDPVQPGGTVTLEFTIDNSGGTDDATDISFTDDLDGNLPGLAAAAGELPIAGCGGTVSGATGDTFLTLSGGSVPAGTSCSFSVLLDVPAAAVPDTYQNVTSAVSATIDAATATLPAATAKLIVVDPVEIGLAKEFTDDPAIPGGTVTLEFELSNPSPTTTITSIAFTDDLTLTLPGLAATGLPLSGPCGTGSTLTGTSELTLTGGSLAPGAVCTFSVTLQVPAGATAGSYNNTTSTVSGDASGPVTGPAASDDLVVDVAPPASADLAITMFDGPDPAGAGDLLVYTGLVKNAGPDTSGPVVVTHTLPAGVTFVETGGCAESPYGGVPHCTIFSIRAGRSAGYQIHVMIDAGATGTLVNIASVASRTTDPNPVNNTAKASTTIKSPPTADAGGPYPAILEGSSVTLNGLGSSDPDQPTATLTFEWDFDGDGNYDDATGPNPSFTAVDGPATVTVGLRVTDDTSLTDSATATVSVNNVDPTLTLSASPVPLNEGSVLNLTVQSINDPGEDTVSSYRFIWGDGTSDTVISTADLDGQGNQLTHVYDDGPSSAGIRVDVTDEDGTFFAGFLSVRVFFPPGPGVHNVAPTAGFDNDGPVDEGSTAVVSFLDQFDPSNADTAAGFRYSYDFDNDGTFEIGDGTYAGSPTAASLTVPSAFLADGPGTRSVGGRIIDKDGGFADLTTVIDINNVAPTIDAITVSSASIDEGDAVTVSGSFSDPALGVPTEAFTGSAIWSDGRSTPLTINSDGTFETSRTFDDDDPVTGTVFDDFTVDITIRDDDLGSDTATSPTITVRNEAPSIVVIGPGASITEGGTVVVGGAFTDPALGVPTETFTGSALWSDGATTPVTVDGTAGTFSTSRTFRDDHPLTGTPSDTFTVDITITDDDGGSDTATSPPVTVSNDPPTITSIAVSPNPLTEGPSSTVNVTGTFVDAALGVPTETFFGSAVWSDGVAGRVTVDSTAGTFSTSRTFRDDHPLTGTPSDTFTVDITITDDDNGDSDAATSPVITVNNAAPVITSIASSATCTSDTGEGDLVTVSGSFTDLGVRDTHQDSLIDWGDGTTTAATVTFSGGSGAFAADHVYPTGGIYTITVTIIDDDTGQASATTIAVVTGVGMVGTSLHAVGTSDDDQTEIKYKAGDDLIEVKADFISPDRRTFPALEVTDIRVVLCGGDDEARIRNGVAVPAMLEGGDGRDELIGGDSPTVMLGGRAKDKLIGSKDRDVIIGGLGKDDINGKDGDDILIGGTTTSDSNVAALQAIFAVWTSSAGFDGRVANLATPLAPNTAVTDDGFKDKLKGDRDRDWFFADLNGLGNDDDQVKDLEDEDLLTLLDTSGTLSFLCRAKWCRGLGPSLPPIGVGLPPRFII